MGTAWLTPGRVLACGRQPPHSVPQKAAEWVLPNRTFPPLQPQADPTVSEQHFPGSSRGFGSSCPAWQGLVPSRSGGGPGGPPSRIVSTWQPRLVTSWGTTGMCSINAALTQSQYPYYWPNGV